MKSSECHKQVTDAQTHTRGQQRVKGPAARSQTLLSEDPPPHLRVSMKLHHRSAHSRPPQQRRQAPCHGRLCLTEAHALRPDEQYG